MTHHSHADIIVAIGDTLEPAVRRANEKKTTSRPKGPQCFFFFAKNQIFNTELIQELVNTFKAM